MSRDIYQILTKLSIKINKAVQDVRDENKLHEYEKDKVIDLDRNLIFKPFREFLKKLFFFQPLAYYRSLLAI